jgi:hypothetical protein
VSGYCNNNNNNDVVDGVVDIWLHVSWRVFAFELSPRSLVLDDCTAWPFSFPLRKKKSGLAERIRNLQRKKRKKNKTGCYLYSLLGVTVAMSFSVWYFFTVCMLSQAILHTWCVWLIKSGSGVSYCLQQPIAIYQRRQGDRILTLWIVYCGLVTVHSSLRMASFAFWYKDTFYKKKIVNNNKNDENSKR